MGSVGQPVPWVEVKIFDEKDKEVPRGTVGEIVTRGPHVMKGYYGMADKTAEALRGGWMHTGDGGYQDQDGFVFIVDRLKDMWVYCVTNDDSRLTNGGCQDHYRWRERVLGRS
jgi:acyl-CoA synthetase (AMP-forming)/AMP-acid ligase II